MKRFASSLLLLLVMSLVVGCASTEQYSFSSNELLLYPVRDNTKPPGGLQEAVIPTRDNLKLHGFLYADGDRSRPVILYLHGNGDTVWSNGMYQWYERVKKHGYRFLAIDYRGYGLSEGRSSVTGLIDDAEAGYGYLTETFPHAQILVWGHSLGTIPAILLGQRHPTAPVVLEGTISNLPDLEAPLEQAFSHGLHTIDLKIVDDHSFDNALAVRKLHNPILMVHGDQDKLARFPVARQMYKTLPAQAKRFYVLRGEGHNYRSSRSIDEVLGEITQFLKTYR